MITRFAVLLLCLLASSPTWALRAAAQAVMRYGKRPKPKQPAPANDKKNWRLARQP